MLLRKILFSLVVSVFIPLFSFAQDGTTLIKTEAGLLWVQNEAPAFFSIEIKGRDVAPSQEYPYLQVDGRPLQVRLVSIKDFHPDKQNRSADSKLLKTHQEWELAHHAELLKTKLHSRSESVRLSNNRETLFWDYATPPQLGRDFPAQSFLTTIIGDHLLVLNAPRFSGEAENAIRDFLLATMASLNVSSARIDIQKLQASIRNGNSANASKLRVLFIGNSYTYYNNLPQMLAGLAASAKPARVLETEMLTVGGATLKRLWDGGQAQQALARGKWDYVVLQEQSTLGMSNVVDGIPQINDPAEFHAAARIFDAEIKKLGAKPLFYMTWARQNNPASQAQLTDAYQKIGKELNDTVAPVGLAWQAVLKARPDIALHVADKSHPNPAGSYLAACVFYATLYGQSPEGLAGRITGALIEEGKVSEKLGELASLSSEDAAFLQKIAWQTVQQHHK